MEAVFWNDGDSEDKERFRLAFYDVDESPSEYDSEKNEWRFEDEATDEDEDADDADVTEVTEDFDAVAASLGSIIEAYDQGVNKVPDEVATAIASTEGHTPESMLLPTRLDSKELLKAARELHTFLHIDNDPKKSWGTVLLGCLEKASGSPIRSEIEAFFTEARADFDDDATQSLESPDAFLTRSLEQGWASHSRERSTPAGMSSCLLSPP